MSSTSIDVAFNKFSACSPNTSIIALSLERIQDSQPLAISVDSLCLHTYSYVKLDIPFCTNLKGVCRPFQQDKHYIDKSSFYADLPRTINLCLSFSVNGSTFFIITSSKFVAFASNIKSI